MDSILEEIVERIKQESITANSSPSEFNKGKKMAYYEVLDMIYNRLTIMGYDPEDFGIDADPFMIVNK